MKICVYCETLKIAINPIESSNFAGHVQKKHGKEYEKYFHNGKYEAPENVAF
jgi:hypothetical protein